MSIPKPANPYFLIRINKQKAEEKKGKIGNIFINSNGVAMTRNMQQGEIVDISEVGREAFPTPKIGDILIFHHFVEGMGKSDAAQTHFVHEDKKYNYYVVSPVIHNGKRNEIYGAIIDGQIVPHPNFVFFEKKGTPIEGGVNKHVNQSVTQTKGGLFVFNGWEDSREKKTARMEEIKAEIQEISSKNTMTPRLKAALSAMEEEMNRISLDLNKKTYIPLKVAHAPAVLSDCFDRQLKSGDVLYVFNRAAETTIDIQNREYIVVEIKYIGFLIENGKFVLNRV